MTDQRRIMCSLILMPILSNRSITSFAPFFIIEGARVNIFGQFRQKIVIEGARENIFDQLRLRLKILKEQIFVQFRI